MTKDGLLEKYGDVAVVGAGVTGRALVEYLTQKNIEVFVTEKDALKPETKNYFQKKGVKFEENGHTRKVLNSDLIVVSPGVPPTIDLIKEANKSGIPTIGEIELAYRLSPAERTIAVTGTNGKSTTVRLIKEILDHAGTNATLCGNIGNPFISAVPSLSPSDIVVVEVSSYQLQTTEKFKPEVGVLTNLEPDHLSRHGSFKNYRKAKLKIFASQIETDHAVINRKLDLEIPNKRPTRVDFGPREPEKLNLLPHQRENLGAALTAVNCLLKGRDFREPPIEPVRNGLNLPHRLEGIEVIDEVEFINDSKATNPAATIAAINGIDRPILLLLGGKAKRSGYGKLVEVLDRSTVRSTYLFGSAKRKLARYLERGGIREFENLPSLKEATKEAFLDSKPGDTVLLSPGCSSFDRYSSFKERGKRFKKIVRALVD